LLYLLSYELVQAALSKLTQGEFCRFRALPLRI